MLGLDPGVLVGEALVVDDLGLDVRLADRTVASYTAAGRDGRSTGLLVERDEGPATATSFRQLTGSDAEFAGWQRFYGRLATLAEDLAPTLTEPLLSETFGMQLQVSHSDGRWAARRRTRATSS